MNHRMCRRHGTATGQHITSTAYYVVSTVHRTCTVVRMQFLVTTGTALALLGAAGTDAWLPAAATGRPRAAAAARAADARCYPGTGAAILASAAGPAAADISPNGGGGGGGGRLVSCAGLTKSYDGGVRYQFRGIGLGLAAGTRAGLVGINGAGKSTLMKCLAGLEAPDAGTVSFEGRPVSWKLRAGHVILRWIDFGTKILILPIDTT